MPLPIRLRFDPDAPAVAVDDPLDAGKAHTGALVLVGTVQALKHAKEFVRVLHVKSGAIVFHEVDSLTGGRVARRTDVNAGFLPATCELQGVVEEVCEDLLEETGVCIAGW